MGLSEKTGRSQPGKFYGVDIGAGEGGLQLILHKIALVSCNYFDWMLSQNRE